MSRRVPCRCLTTPTPSTEDMLRQRSVLLGLSSAFGLLLAVAAGPQATGQARSEVGDAPRVLLRLAADSGVVGHYKFAVRERQRLVFDLPEGDPRASLLRSASEPRETLTEIAATVVAVTSDTEEECRYIAYWLGYRLSGDQVQGLTPLQWDSIFQKVGRSAVLRFTLRGEPRGVQVSSDAVRPVAQALAQALSGLAMSLPADSVTQGSVWEGNVAVQVAAPDGSRRAVPVRVTYRLREIRDEPGGLKARIEFDGEPFGTGTEDATFSGRYFGESLFAVNAGRYEQLMALANLELNWKDTSGLPPNHSVVEWQTQVTRN